jgi:hypothetical protein
MLSICKSNIKLTITVGLLAMILARSAFAGPLPSCPENSLGDCKCYVAADGKQKLVGVVRNVSESTCTGADAKAFRATCQWGCASDSENPGI